MCLLTYRFANMSFGLPPSKMSMRIEEALGVAIGRVMRVDCDSSGSCVGEFLRIRVGMTYHCHLREGCKYGCVMRREVCWWECCCNMIDFLISISCVISYTTKGFIVPIIREKGPIHEFKTPYGTWLRAGQSTQDRYGGLGLLGSV